MELLLGAAATLRFPEAGGDWVASETAPTVTVTRASDGEEVLKEAETTEAEEDGHTYWTASVPAQPEVDLLTALWSFEAGEEEEKVISTYETRAEIVGGFACSLGAVEAKLGEEADLGALEAMREVSHREIEAACGVAFRPRYGTETLTGSGTRRLLLDHKQVLRVISVTVDGTALTEAELEALTIDPIGALVSESIWPATTKSNIVIQLVHGYEAYPAAGPVIRDYAAYLLRESPSDWNERATAISNDLGTYSLVTPGYRGASFPLPSVNAFCDRHVTALVG